MLAAVLLMYATFAVACMGLLMYLARKREGV